MGREEGGRRRSPAAGHQERPEEPGAEGRALLGLDPRLPAVWAGVGARMAFGAGHDPGHLWRVARWTLACAPGEAPGLAVAAALTHDLVNLPKDHPERVQASARSAEAAGGLLTGLGFEADEVRAIVLAVRDHSYSRGAVPEHDLGRALQDADRLDALGALGVLRCAAVGGALGRALLDPADPWARARRLDDGRYSLDHFFTKLLRLPDGFHTPVGRAEAGRRAAVMRAFLADLGTELGAGCPEPAALR